MLDVGASFGFYSLNYARAAGPASRVWSFEPTPSVCSFVQESIRLNALPNVSLHETAVGAAKGRSRFVAEQNSELNRLDAVGGGIEVAVAPLDSLDTEHGFGNVDLVKLDVEGHEAEAVAGGAAFFARESPLVMLEVKAGSTVDFSAAARLEALGYSLFRLVPQFGVLVPFDRAQVDPFLLNIFACKPDRAARLAERGLLCATVAETAPMATVADVRAALAIIPALAGIATEIEGLFANVPAGDPLLQLLGYEVASRDESATAAARCASLGRAADIARRLVAGQPHFARALTAARVLRGWGERGAASSVMLHLLRMILGGVACHIGAPFLPPLASYDAWPAQGDPGAWVSASIVEAAALWSSFSGYWGEPTPAPASEVLLRFGRQTALFERRRQLRRIIEGRQAGPEPHPLLREKTPANLNPSHWCGGIA
jgi:FkbM family methyltransferase